MNEDSTYFILRGGMPCREDYLLRCLQLRLPVNEVNETWAKVTMTTNKNLQYRYLKEIGYFD